MSGFHERTENNRIGRVHRWIDKLTGEHVLAVYDKVWDRFLPPDDRQPWRWVRTIVISVLVWLAAVLAGAVLAAY